MVQLNNQRHSHADSLCKALAPVLDVPPTDQKLLRLADDLLQILPDWFGLYYNGPRFYAQAVMTFQEGAVWTWQFGVTRKRGKVG